MATLKLIKDNQAKKNLVCVPGGPGLGPISFELMAEFITAGNIYFYYPSGTDGKPVNEQALDYENQLKELESQINSVENVVLLGHSFGGILATDLTIRNPDKVSALVCMAAPFSKDVFKSASDAFSEVQNAESAKINEKFQNDPTDENYKKWFSHYAALYFKNGNDEAGKQMILSDSACAKSYLAARSESAQKEFLIDEIEKINTAKLFIMGSEDALLKKELLSQDAMKGKFRMKTIKDAGHFVHFDQPEEVANVIDAFIKGMEK